MKIAVERLKYWLYQRLPFHLISLLRYEWCTKKYIKIFGWIIATSFRCRSTFSWENHTPSQKAKKLLNKCIWTLQVSIIRTTWCFLKLDWFLRLMKVCRKQRTKWHSWHPYLRQIAELLTDYPRAIGNAKRVLLLEGGSLWLIIIVVCFTFSFAGNNLYRT